MDLHCPHCARRVTIPDDKAGQVMSCPLCAKQFMAPSLPTPSAAPKPAVPSSPAPVGTYGMGPDSAPKTPPASAPAPTEPAPAPPPPPPAPPGEYTRSFVLHLRETWLAFVTPACLLLIFVLSFFNWHSTEPTRSFSLWGLSFSEAPVGQGQFLAYTILMFLCFPLSVAAMLFDRGWLVTPPKMAPILMFRNLLVALFLGMAFLALGYDYLNAHFLAHANPIALAMKLAFRLHGAAILASFLMFWLHWRKRSNLPAPKIEAHV